MKPALVPWPQKISFFNARFKPGKKLTVNIQQKSLRRCAGFLADILKTHARMPVRTVSVPADVTLVIDRNVVKPTGDGRERYLVAVEPEGITVIGACEKSVLAGTSTVAQLLLSSGRLGIPCLRIEDEAALGKRGMHLDLRVQQMTVPYIKQLLDNLALLKYNFLVIEWEDKFPYKNHPLIASETCYSPADIKEIFAHAKDRGIEVVPQLQCLGHVTYILKHDLYAHLRETPDDTWQMCPGKKGSLDLFRQLAAELVDAHPDSEYFHIGGDETWTLGTCPSCARTAAKKGKSHLYAEYIKKVCRAISDLGRTPVLWGDIVLTHPGKIKTLPKNLVMNDWDYESAGDKPHLSMKGRKNDWRAMGLKHFDRLAKAGFPVLASPAVRSAPDGVYNLDFKKHAANVAGFCSKAVRSGALGTLITNWATTGGFERKRAEWGEYPRFTGTRPRTPRLPLEITWLLLGLGAQFSWGRKNPPVKTAAVNFGRLWFGFTAEQAARYYQAQQLISSRVDGRSSAARSRTKLVRALGLAGGLRPSRNPECFKHFLFLLQLSRHHINKVGLLDDARKRLNAGRRDRRLVRLLQELHREAVRMAKVNSILLDGIYYQNEIEYDNRKKFFMELDTFRRYVALLK